jgi:hypothetical protein
VLLWGPFFFVYASQAGAAARRYLQSECRYAGSDSVVVDVDFQMGSVRRINYRITVC